MKLSSKQLRKVIKEEIEKVIKEANTAVGPAQPPHSGGTAVGPPSDTFDSDLSKAEAQAKWKAKLKQAGQMVNQGMMDRKEYDELVKKAKAEIAGEAPKEPVGGGETAVGPVAGMSVPADDLSKAIKGVHQVEKLLQDLLGQIK